MNSYVGEAKEELENEQSKSRQILSMGGSPGALSEELVT